MWLCEKPASPGRDKLTTVVLQGHLDMVCEKNADKTHDFTKDPIDLVRKGNVLMADGTTLGADNGIAVATNLAIMEDKQPRARTARAPVYGGRRDRTDWRRQPPTRLSDRPDAVESGLRGRR